MFCDVCVFCFGDVGVVIVYLYLYVVGFLLNVEGDYFGCGVIV